MLTQAERDGFRDLGYVIRRGALSEPQLVEYRAAVDRVVAHCEGPDGYGDARRGPDGQIWGVNNIFHPSVREPVLLSALGEPGILGVISDLVGPELQYHLCTLLVNPAELSYRLRWHRDSAFDGDAEEAALLTALDTHVQLNGALRRDHCLSIVPGSHRRVMTPGERDAMQTNPDGAMPGQMAVELDAGDIVFYNSNLLHRGDCAEGDNRQTLHYAVLAHHPDAPTGPDGQPWLTDPDFLGTLPPPLRALFDNWLRSG